MSGASRKRALSGPVTTNSPKRKKYLCSYQTSWEKDFNWLRKSDQGVHDAFCTTCFTNFGIGFGARNDISTHDKSVTHVRLQKERDGTKSMNSFMKLANDPFIEKVTRAETMFSFFVAEHNFTQCKRFGTLCKLAFALLSLPNSNSDSERTFSMVRKIVTDYRSELANETICSLLCTKINSDTVCYEYKPSKAVLKMAKTATQRYNESL